MTGETFERAFPATDGGLRDGAAFLDEVCPNPRVSIVFDELVSNIVRCSGATSFMVRLVHAADVTMTLEDDGVAFDPTATAEPDVTVPVQDRVIGGLGLLMVRKMSKSFSYRREGDRNVTTVVM